MAFRYTRPPLTQGISTVLLIGLALGAMALPGAPSVWAAYLAHTPEWVQIIGALMVVHLLLFWGMVAAFSVVDRHDWPHFIAKHRIQSGKPKRPALGPVLRNLAVNQLVWAPLMLVLIWGLLHVRGWAPDPALPSALQVLAELLGMSVCSMIWFYASHRFLHRKWWMKRVHRVHHEFRTTSAIASEYAHGVEFVVANFGTLGCGVVLLAPSLPSIYLFTVVSLHTILVHHSGYALPWMSWSVHHDWHHYKYTECFGTLGIIDRVLGTDPVFRTLEDGEERP